MTAPTTLPARGGPDLAPWLGALDLWAGEWSDTEHARDFLRDLWRRPAGPRGELRCAALDHFALAGWVPCHAAAFGDRRVAIAPGASGSGKSALAVTLAREGIGVSDELVFLKEDAGRVVATTAPLPLAVSDETLALLPFAEAWRFDVRWPAGDGGSDNKAFLLPPRPLAGTCEVAAVVLRHRDGQGRPAKLDRVEGLAAATGLLGNTYRFLNGGNSYAEARRRAWRVVTALAEDVPCWTIEGDLLAGREVVCEVARIVGKRTRGVA